MAGGGSGSGQQAQQQQGVAEGLWNPLNNYGGAPPGQSQGMGLYSSTQSAFPNLPGYQAPVAGQQTPEQQMMQQLTQGAPNPMQSGGFTPRGAYDPPSTGVGQLMQQQGGAGGGK